MFNFHFITEGNRSTSWSHMFTSVQVRWKEHFLLSLSYASSPYTTSKSFRLNTLCYNYCSLLYQVFNHSWTSDDTLQFLDAKRKEVQGRERTRVCTELKELVFCSCKDAEIASIKQSMRLTAIWTYLGFELSLPAVFLLNRDSFSKNEQF